MKWSEYMDAHVYLCLGWMHKSEGMACYVAAQFIWIAWTLFYIFRLIFCNFVTFGFSSTC